MHEAFIIVAAILFFIDFVLWWVPNVPFSFSALVGAH